MRPTLQSLTTTVPHFPPGVWEFVGTRHRFPQNVLLVGPFWHRELTTDPHITAHASTECPNVKYPKLVTDISEMIFDSYEYTPVAYVTEHIMICRSRRGYRKFLD
jgi:hypothetical protein